jgi:hypothetical protein
MEEKVIYLKDYLPNRRRRKRKYGDRICCPECDAHEFWKVYCLNEKLEITAIVCTSDECDSETIIPVEGGVLK